MATAKNPDCYDTTNMTLAAVVMVKMGKEPNVTQEPRGFRYYFHDEDGSIAWFMKYGLSGETIDIQQLLHALDQIRRGISETFGRR